MAKKGDYKNNYGTGHQTGEQQTEGKKAEHGGKTRDTDWYETQYHQDFAGGLASGEAQEAYDKGQNLTQYKNDAERREILADYV